MYQNWLAHLFDHEELQDWQFSVDQLKLDSAEVIELTAKMFQDYEHGYGKYSDWQIGTGLYYLLSNNCSDYSFALRDGPAPLKKRVNCILSLKNLFKDCFNSRCKQSLGHLNQPGNQLNSTCFILWDTSPLSYCEDSRDKNELYEAVMDVMEYSLYLSNLACIESGLHGLGHLVDYHPEARKIINKYLATKPIIPQSLHQYALQAKTGCVQ
jgi:hypothetical protein